MDLSFIGVALHAVEKGAASVYHAVLATGEDIHAWEASNPILAPLVHSGLTYVHDFLARVGVPVDTIVLTAEDIVVGLKHLAAADATVPSQVPPITLLGGITLPATLAVAETVAEALDPALVPAVAIAEAVADTAAINLDAPLVVDPIVPAAAPAPAAS